MTSKLTVRFPSFLIEETKYSLDIVLNEFLGLDYLGEEHSYNYIEIACPGYDTVLQVNADFIINGHSNWLTSASLPQTPLARWRPEKDGLNVDLIETPVPVIYGYPGLVKAQDIWTLNLDIFGSIFFMLSQYEELIRCERDNHDRFTARMSISYQEAFLTRPIVDEYIEILWACMRAIWPSIERKQCQGQTLVSCDVDVPFDHTVNNFPTLLRALGGDLLKRKNPIEAIKRLNRYCFNKIGIYKFDRMYTFDWYMDVCEGSGLKASFYFIPDSSEPNNGCYKINEPRIVKLMKSINKRGHEIGVHGSYFTYQSPSKIKAQTRLLKETIVRSGLDIEITGNRQHYLRWDSSQTPEHLNLAGFKYDTTGTFAESAGFRYGTSKEFSMWGWQSRTTLAIKQRPLIIMESSVLSDQYAGLGYTDEAMSHMKLLKARASKYGGNFTILWHNSHLLTEKDKMFFEEIIK
jgi:hypothetical protein